MHLDFLTTTVLCYNGLGKGRTLRNFLIRARGPNLLQNDFGCLSQVPCSIQSMPGICCQALLSQTWLDLITLRSPPKVVSSVFVDEAATL